MLLRGPAQSKFSIKQAKTYETTITVQLNGTEEQNADTFANPLAGQEMLSGRLRVAGNPNL